jgi:hypothetical protein
MSLQKKDLGAKQKEILAEALHLIDTESFDALLSNLHMPGAGDQAAGVAA